MPIGTTRGTLLWLAASLVLFSGCATAPSGASDDQESLTEQSDMQRPVPPEVTDHTVDGRPEYTRSVRPRVDVNFDEGSLIGVDRESYEVSVRRGAQQCYSRTVRLQQSEAEGSIVYEVLVTRNGQVAGTDVMSSGLRNSDISRCVERVIGRLKFDVPVRNRPVFRLFFRLDFYLESLVPEDPPV